MPEHQHISIPAPESIPLPEDILLPKPLEATIESSSAQIPDLSEIELPAVAPPPDEASSQPVKIERQSNKVSSSTPTTNHYEQKKRKRKHRSQQRDKDDDSLNMSAFRDEQSTMAKIMGFSNFDSTKGKQVPGNQVGAVHVVKKRRYRQYMNRKGGFNRPLDKVA